MVKNRLLMEFILDEIRAKHGDEPDIVFLADEVQRGNIHARKQLADMISNQPAKLRGSHLLEVSKWGIIEGEVFAG